MNPYSRGHPLVGVLVDQINATVGPILADLEARR
jgi:hypothetical protein